MKDRIPIIAEWSFSLGDLFHWTPFGTHLRLVDMEGGIGRFIEIRGFDGPAINGSPIWEWPLDQHVLQGRHIRQVPRVA